MWWLLGLLVGVPVLGGLLAMWERWREWKWDRDLNRWMERRRRGEEEGE